MGLHLGVERPFELCHLNVEYGQSGLESALLEVLEERLVRRLTHVKNVVDVTTESKRRHRITLKQANPGGHYYDLHAACHGVGHDHGDVAQQGLYELVTEVVAAHLVGQFQQQPAEVLGGLVGLLVLRLSPIDVGVGENQVARSEAVESAHQQIRLLGEVRRDLQSSSVDSHKRTTSKKQ